MSDDVKKASLGELKKSLGNPDNHPSILEGVHGLEMNAADQSLRREGYEFIELDSSNGIQGLWDSIKEESRVDPINKQNIDLGIYTNGDNKGAYVGLGGGRPNLYWDFTGDTSENAQLHAGIKKVMDNSLATRGTITGKNALHPEAILHSTNDSGLGLFGAVKKEFSEKISATFNGFAGYNLTQKTPGSTVGGILDIDFSEKTAGTLSQSIATAGIKNFTATSHTGLEVRQKLSDNVSGRAGLLRSSTIIGEPYNITTSYVGTEIKHIHLSDTFNDASLNATLAFSTYGVPGLESQTGFSVGAVAGHDLKVKLGKNDDQTTINVGVGGSINNYGGTVTATPTIAVHAPIHELLGKSVPKIPGF